MFPSITFFHPSPLFSAKSSFFYPIPFYSTITPLYIIPLLLLVPLVLPYYLGSVQGHSDQRREPCVGHTLFLSAWAELTGAFEPVAGDYCHCLDYGYTRPSLPPLSLHMYLLVTPSFTFFSFSCLCIPGLRYLLERKVKYNDRDEC